MENEKIDHPRISLQARRLPGGGVTDLTETGDGELDDLAVDNPESFRLDRMSESHVWTAVYLGDGKRLMINFVAENGNIRITDWIE